MPAAHRALRHRAAVLLLWAGVVLAVLVAAAPVGLAIIIIPSEDLP